MSPFLLLIPLELLRRGLHTVLGSIYLLSNVLEHGSLQSVAFQFEWIFRGVRTVLQRRYLLSIEFGRCLHKTTVQRLTYNSSVRVKYLLNKLREHVSLPPVAGHYGFLQRVSKVRRSMYLRNKVREHGSLRPTAAT